MVEPDQNPLMALATARRTWLENQANKPLAETLEQIEVCENAVDAIITSMCVGRTDKKISVSLSGHANPNHEPTPGWANDMVSISIVQQT